MHFILVSGRMGASIPARRFGLASDVRGFLACSRERPPRNGDMARLQLWGKYFKVLSLYIITTIGLNRKFSPCRSVPGSLAFRLAALLFAVSG